MWAWLTKKPGYLTISRRPRNLYACDIFLLVWGTSSDRGVRPNIVCLSRSVVWSCPQSTIVIPYKLRMLDMLFCSVFLCLWEFNTLYHDHLIMHVYDHQQGDRHALKRCCEGWHVRHDGTHPCNIPPSEICLWAISKILLKAVSRDFETKRSTATVLVPPSIWSLSMIRCATCLGRESQSASQSIFGSAQEIAVLVLSLWWEWHQAILLLIGQGSLLKKLQRWWKDQGQSFLSSAHCSSMYGTIKTEWSKKLLSKYIWNLLSKTPSACYSSARQKEQERAIRMSPASSATALVSQRRNTYFISNSSSSTTLYFSLAVNRAYIGMRCSLKWMVVAQDSRVKSLEHPDKSLARCWIALHSTDTTDYWRRMYKLPDFCASGANPAHQGVASTKAIVRLYFD